MHIPLLRKGEPYKSLDVARVAHHGTREAFVEVSQANVGLIRRDLLSQREGREALARIPSSELLKMCARAAEHFMDDELPLGDEGQTPSDYVRQVSATTGLPHVLVRRNMSKIRGVLAEMESVLAGLTRNLDLSILDAGVGEAEGHALSYFPRAESLGVVLPNNSPGVHALWVPAFALKIPLVLKPGSAEPWTPYRIIQALLRAGAPPAAFSFYPTDHAGAGEILRSCGRGMLFGDAGTSGAWRGDPRVEIHGPGYSKVVIGEDKMDEWEKHWTCSSLRSRRTAGARASTLRASGFLRARRRLPGRSPNVSRASARATPRTRKRCSPPSPTRAWPRVSTLQSRTRSASRARAT